MHRLIRRPVMALAGLIGLSLGSGAWAQDAYPARAVTLVIPLSAGSQIDIIGRALAEGLGKQLAQPVVVLNKEGASTTIGLDAVAKAKADGYTLGFGPDGGLIVQPHLNPNLPYKVDDFEFLCQTNVATFVFIVGPQSPFKTATDLIEAARKEPGKISLGTAGIATSMHLLAESVSSEAGVKFNHVPFRNIGDLAVQTLNGTVDVTVTVPNMLAANVQKGMRALAMSGDSKLPNLPPIASLRELGFKQSAPSSVIGLYGPKGMPTDAVAMLRGACQRVVESAGFTGAAAKTLTAVDFGDGATYARAVQQGSRAAGEMMKKLNIKAQ